VNRYVVLVVDETKIRADLVFNKTSGEITGFVDYGEGTLEHKFQELHQQCKQQKLSEREVTYVNCDGQGVNVSYGFTNRSFCNYRYV